MAGPNVNQYGASAILGAFFGLSSYPPPSSLWVGLTLLGVADRSANGTTVATSGLEIGTGLGYARQEIPSGDSYWAEVAAGVIATVNQVIFDTATDDWGDVKGWFLATAVTAGDLITAGPLPASFFVAAGIQATIDAGVLAYTLESADEATIL